MPYCQDYHRRCRRSLERATGDRPKRINLSLHEPCTSADAERSDEDRGDRRQVRGVTYGCDANGNRNNTCAYAYALDIISAT